MEKKYKRLSTKRILVTGILHGIAEAIDAEKANFAKNRETTGQSKDGKIVVKRVSN
jgi:hypothetical protein